MTNDKRKALARKIKALLNLANDEAATTAEAANAARKAANLMQKYEMSKTQVELETEDYGFFSEKFATGKKRFTFHPTFLCALEVAELYSCVSYTRGNEIVFFGTELNRELAYYTLEMIKNISEASLKAAKKTQKINRRDYLKSFTVGVRKQLRVQVEASRKAATESKNSVVPLSMTLTKFATMGPKLGLHKTSWRNEKYRDQKSTDAGMNAGTNANLSKGVRRKPKAAIAA